MRWPLGNRRSSNAVGPLRTLIAGWRAGVGVTHWKDGVIGRRARGWDPGASGLWWNGIPRGTMDEVSSHLGAKMIFMAGFAIFTAASDGCLVTREFREKLRCRSKWLVEQGGAAPHCG